MPVITRYAATPRCRRQFKSASMTTRVGGGGEANVVVAIVVAPAVAGPLPPTTTTVPVVVVVTTVLLAELKKITPVVLSNSKRLATNPNDPTTMLMTATAVRMPGRRRSSSGLR